MARKKHHRSPSRNVSRPVDPRLQEALFKDAVQYSIFMTNLAYWKMHADLLFLSKRHDNPLTPRDQYHEVEVSAMANAWQVIDSTHRLRTLLDRGPSLMRIPTKDTECRLFMKQTDVVEQLRHTIQHLDNKIFDFVAIRLPALGSLNWLAKLDDTPGCKTFTLIPGTLFERTQPLINPVGKTFNVPIGKITLISTAAADLSDIVLVQIDRLADWLNKNIGVDCTRPGQSLMMSADVVPRTETTEPDTSG